MYTLWEKISAQEELHLMSAYTLILTFLMMWSLGHLFKKVEKIDSESQTTTIILVYRGKLNRTVTKWLTKPKPSLE